MKIDDMFGVDGARKIVQTARLKPCASCCLQRSCGDGTMLKTLVITLINILTFSERDPVLEATALSRLRTMRTKTGTEHAHEKQDLLTRVRRRNESKASSITSSSARVAHTTPQLEVSNQTNTDELSFHPTADESLLAV